MFDKSTYAQLQLVAIMGALTLKGKHKRAKKCKEDGMCN